MAAPDTNGLRLRSYQILTKPDGSLWELGAGSFGRTFRARHAILGTAVALKIVHDHLTGDSRVRTRFLREAREQARMEHPNIAAITYCDEVDGTMFYVMELCEGGDLKRLVEERGPLTPAETVHVMLHTAEALQFAHGRGFIHRDLKPSSLLLVFDPDGVPVVKLTDFGLGKTTGGSADMTTGLLGLKSDKSMTCSPEEARNERLDARSDLFSLGMTAWYLLAGGPPIPGKPAEVLSDRLSDEEYGARLPEHLTGLPRQILTRLLRKNPADRYPSAAELLVDLRECAAAMPVPVRDWRVPPDPAEMPPAPPARPEPPSAPHREPEPEPVSVSSVSRTECRKALEDALRAIGEAEETTTAILQTVAASAEPVPEAREPLEMLRHWTDRVPRWRAECQALLGREPETPDAALALAVDRAAALARQAGDAVEQTRVWARRVESEVRRAAELRRHLEQLRQLEGTLQAAREPVRPPAAPDPAAPQTEPVPPQPSPPVPPASPDRESEVWQRPSAPVSPASTGAGGPPGGWGRGRVAVIGVAVAVLAGAAAWYWRAKGGNGGGGDVVPPPVVQTDWNDSDPPGPDGPRGNPSDDPAGDDPDPQPPPPPAEFPAEFVLAGDLPAEPGTIEFSGLTPAGGLTMEGESTFRGRFRDAEGAPITVHPPAGFVVTEPTSPVLQSRVRITLARTTGRVQWSPPEGSPYSRLEFSWRGPLPGEEQARPSAPVVGDAGSGRIVLPTGIWDVTADDGFPGDEPAPDGAVIEARPLGRVEVRADTGSTVSVPGFPELLEGYGFITPGKDVISRETGDGVHDVLRKFEQTTRSRSRRAWCRLDTWEKSDWRYPSLVRAGWKDGSFFLEYTDYATAFKLIPSLYAIVRGCELNGIRNFELQDIRPPGAMDDPVAAFRAIQEAVDTLGRARITRLPRDLRDHASLASDAWKDWMDPKHRGTGPGKLVRLTAAGAATLTLQLDVQGSIRPVTLQLVPGENGRTWTLTGGTQGFEEFRAELHLVPQAPDPEPDSPQSPSPEEP